MCVPAEGGTHAASRKRTHGAHCVQVHALADAKEDGGHDHEPEAVVTAQ
jgi:hypothetical protein